MRRPLWILAAGGVVALAIGVFWFVKQEEVPRAVKVPELSALAQAGKQVFDRRCGRCHGEHGQGSANGPPLVHRIYHPGHHADVTFDLAVRRGVRAHHWRFGDMPPQPAVTPTEVSQITRYVRELQMANGIY